jgi:hypothetical protein
VKGFNCGEGFQVKKKCSGFVKEKKDTFDDDVGRR